MDYVIPNVSASLDFNDNLKNIEKIVDSLNKRRDKGLDQEVLQNLKKHLLISSVYNSNAIEGNTLSLRETEIILDGMQVNERPLKDEIEARSLAHATEYLYMLINGSEQLSKRCLLELHTLLMEGIPNAKGGTYRTEDVSIKNSDHKPINWMYVPSEVDHMFKWMNRNMHKYNPIVMCAILHHWLVWIHPFSDGNGRVTRLFTNFFLLQKGYPEIVVRIGDRDKYYDALIDGDKCDITKLVDLFSDKIRQTVTVYEGFFNEYDRQLAWKQKYKDIGNGNYSKAKETFAYQYEVWKNQLGVFSTVFTKNVEALEKLLPHLLFEIKDYGIISYEQYLDMIEDRKISNTWYFKLTVSKKETNKNMSFVFYFGRLKTTGKANVVKGTDTGERPHIKLFVTARKFQKSFRLNKSVDLVNVGTYKDELSFGVINRKWDRNLGSQNEKPFVITVKDNPNKIVRTFLDQILYNFFDVNRKKKPQQ